MLDGNYKEILDPAIELLGFEPVRSDGLCLFRPQLRHAGNFSILSKK